MKHFPPGWSSALFGEVVRIESDLADPRLTPDAPHIAPNHIVSKTGELLPYATVREDGVTSPKHRFRPGHILYSKIRPYLAKAVLVDFPGLCSADMYPLATELDPRFLLRWLLSDEFTTRVAQDQGRTVLPKVNQAALAAIDVPVPPLKEQSRIADKLEAALACTRKARASLEAVPPLLDQLRQSILAAAFRGDLTADWRSSHPGESTAAADVERLRKRRESLGAASFTTSGEPPRVLPQLPDGWTWARLGELGRDPLAAVQTGPFGAQLHNDEFVAEGVPVIAVGNLTRTGFTQEGLYFVTAEKAHQLARYDVQAGDVLFARSGATLGKVCVAPEFAANWRMTGHILRLRLDESILMPDVAVFALRGAEIVTKQVQSGVRGMTRPGYNTALLERIWVPVPPRGEQVEMVRQILTAFTRVDRLDAATRLCESDLQRCDQAIAAKAFRGELVPQEPADESASQLLERIRAARENAEAGTGTRRRARRVVDDDGVDAPAPSLRSTPNRNATKDVNELAPAALHDEVFSALWTRGPLEKDDAVRQVAEHLREAGFVEFQRLRTDGPLYARVLGFIDAAVNAGHLDRPKRGQVRACKPDATAYTADDWRHALLAVLGPSPTDRDDDIRAAAEWARDTCGLEFTRLRADGHIITGLRSALSSAIRRGEVVRHGADRIARSTEPLPKGQLSFTDLSPTGRGEPR